MRLLIFAIILFLIALSLFVDYRWKRWIARQREMRERNSGEFRS